MLCRAVGSQQNMGCCQNRDRCCSIWRIVQSSLGIFIGISTAFVFYHNFHNAQAAGWALASGVFAAAALHLAILIHKKTIRSWYSVLHLRSIQLLAFLVTDISMAAFVWYLFYAAYYKIPMVPVDNSAIVTSVWVFMTAKWTFLIWLFARLGIKEFNYDHLSETENF